MKYDNYLMDWHDICIDINGPQRTNPAADPDFSYSATMWFTFVVLTTFSQRLLDILS